MADQGTEGLDALKQKYVEQAKRGVVKKSNQCEIKGGDVAVIKFIQDANKIFVCGFHAVPTKGKFGEYNQDVYCLAQDGEPCPFCEQIGEDIAILAGAVALVIFIGIAIKHHTETKGRR